MNKKIDIYIDFNAQSAIQSANNPISKCQHGTLKFSILLSFVLHLLYNKAQKEVKL